EDVVEQRFGAVAPGGKGDLSPCRPIATCTPAALNEHAAVGRLLPEPAAVLPVDRRVARLVADLGKESTQDPFVQERIAHRRPGRRGSFLEPAEELLLHLRPFRKKIGRDVFPLGGAAVLGELPGAKTDAAALHHAEERFLLWL